MNTNEVLVLKAQYTDALMSIVANHVAHTREDIIDIFSEYSNEEYGIAALLLAKDDVPVGDTYEVLMRVCAEGEAGTDYIKVCYVPMVDSDNQDEQQDTVLLVKLDHWDKYVIA